jgi:glucose/arabinose dehydrogenase
MHTRAALTFSLLLAPLVVACGDPSSSPDARDGDAGADARDGTAPDAPTDAGDDSAIAANRPELRPATDALIAQLRVPAGFRLSVVARGLVQPRMLAVGPDGSVYVTSPMNGEVRRLHDANDDGDVSDAGENTVVLGKTDDPALAGVHGITIAGGKMYLASVKAVFVATLSAGVPTGLTKLVGDLPDGGQHPNRTIGLGPDGKLYVSVGSDCNACPESDTEHATFLRFNPDGTVPANPANPAHPVLAHDPNATVTPRVYASGLRNTLGFDWAPGTNELWGMDQGSDGLGDDLPPEELNRVTGGASYGWPYCFADRQPDFTADDPSKQMSKAEYCPKTVGSIATVPAHSSPIAFVFYRASQFPPAYRGGAFLTLRGSWNRSVPTGYKVVYVPFSDGAPSGAPLDVLSGFLIENGAAQFGRLAGLAVEADGSLLVSEDTNGVIYRLQYGADVDGGADGSGGDAGADGEADASSDAR